MIGISKKLVEMKSTMSLNSHNASNYCLSSKSIGIIMLEIVGSCWQTCQGGNNFIIIYDIDDLHIG